MIKTTSMIFNTEMVRALLAGNKTQTRRIFKQPKGSVLEEISLPWLRPTVWFPEKEESVLLDCPFGKAGDLIAVRETLGINVYLDMYYSSDCLAVMNAEPEGYVYRSLEYVGGIPSIHMPRWASRLTLKINSVRVERIQDISKEDAIAEGFDYSKSESAAKQGFAIGARTNFRHTWESIYGDSWDKNEWVWVMDFEVINKNVDVVLAEMEQAA